MISILALMGLNVQNDRLSVRVNPQIVMAGYSLNLYCHVPRDPHNRWLDYGLTDYQASGRQLEGEMAPITFGPIMFHKIPCDVDTAFCRITRDDGTQMQVAARVTVAGCDGE